MLTVLSLCDASGVWSQPYVDAGYDVRRVDLENGADVRLFQALPYPVRGVLAVAGGGRRLRAHQRRLPLLHLSVSRPSGDAHPRQMLRAWAAPTPGQ